MAEAFAHKRSCLTRIGAVAGVLAAIIALCSLIILVRSYSGIYQRPLADRVTPLEAVVSDGVYWLTTVFIAIVGYYAARSGLSYARLIFLAIAIVLTLGSTVSALLLAPHVSLSQSYTEGFLSEELHLTYIPALSLLLCIGALRRKGNRCGPPAMPASVPRDKPGKARSDRRWKRCASMPRPTS